MRCQGLVNVDDCRQLLPPYREICRIEARNGLGVPDRSGDRFSAKPCFALGEDGLISELRDYPVTVLPRNIPGREHANDSGMPCNKRVEIAEGEPGPIVGAPDCPEGHGSRRKLVGAEDLPALNLTLPIEPNQPLADRSASQG